MEIPDMDGIKAGLDLATKTSGSLKSALDVLAKIKQLGKQDGPKSTEQQALVQELADQLAQVRLDNVDLKERLVELREELLKMRKLQSKLASYEWYTAPNGTKVYVTKEKGEAEHYACPVCMAEDIISVLQPALDGKRCLKCENYFRFQKSEGWTQNHKTGIVV